MPASAIVICCGPQNRPTCPVETTRLSLSSQTRQRRLRRLLPRAEVLQPSQESKDSQTPAFSRKSTIAICLCIAFVAIGVRLLLWQDNRPVFPGVFMGMVEHHKANARVLLKGDINHFL